MSKQEKVSIKLDKTTIVDRDRVLKGSLIPVSPETASLLIGIKKAHYAKEGEKHDPIKEPNTKKQDANK